MKPLALEGRVAIVTGAASGIGYATAQLFAKEGAKVVIVDINSADGLKNEKQIKDNKREAMFVEADVSNPNDTKRIVDSTVKKFRKLDIMFNNVGINPSGTVVTTTVEDWDRIMNVNLKSVFLGSKYAAMQMVRQGHGGNIVNMASVSGLEGNHNEAAYCASKGGVILLTKASALDLAPYGIRVNCICPGGVDTPIMRKVLEGNEKTRESYLRLHPINGGRVGTPDEIAHSVLFLVSDESSFITGSTLVVDGGRTAGTHFRFWA